MKKFLIAILMCFPLIAYAGCEGQISGGGSSGSTYSGSCTSGCCSGFNGNTCLWEWGSKKGLRFQIYIVNSSSSATLLGKGVDVWGNDPGGGTFTKPSNNDLQRKFNCYSEWPSLDSARTIRSNLSVSREEYLTGNYGTVVVRNGILSASSVNDWAFTYKNHKPTGGFLKAELFDKLISKDYAYIKEVWSLTDSDITKLNNGIIDGTAYVTAEVIYQYNDAHNGNLFHGTVSENAFLHSCTTPEVWLYTTTSDPNSGTLVTNSSSSPIHKVSAYNGEEKYGNNGYPDATHAYYSACNYAWGWTSWNVKDVCEDCGGCESECGYTKKGTAGRAACAVAFCNKKEKDNKATCIKTCTNVPEDKPCDSKTNKTCEDYKVDKSKPIELSCKDFSVSERDGLSKTIEKNVCYDSKTYDGDVTESTYMVDTLKYGVNYYRINCTDTMNLKNLPSKQEVYISKTTTANIHFSYKLDRKVSCSIEYRASDDYIKEHKTYFIAMDKDPDKDIKDSKEREKYKANYRIFQDIKNVKSAIDGAKKRKEEINSANYSDDTKKELIEIQDKTIEYLNSMLTELNKTIKISKDRLASITSKKNNPEKIKLNVLNLKIVDETDYRTVEEELELEPVGCTVDEIDNKCLLNGLTGTGESYTEITCDDTVGETVTGKSGTVSTFTETIIYSLPDSYVAAQSEGEGSVYYTEKECEDAVKAANGMCKIIEFGFALPPFDGNNIKDYVDRLNAVPGKIQLEIEGGLCDELKFNYNCDYTATETYCAKCKGKTGDDYLTCAKKECGCDAYCGSDQVCREKFCPEPCPICGAEVTCDTCHEKCSEWATDKTSEKYIVCYYDECCNKECDGDCKCLLECCVDKCTELYSHNPSELSKCKTECYKTIDCPEEYPEYPNYIYRSIDQRNPFPDREKNVGNNWYNKIDFIKKAEDATTKYHDETNGMNDKYEYSIKVSSKQLKEIKKKVDTYYKSFGKSDNYFSTKSKDAYCSTFLYEELNHMGVKVKIGDTGSYDCKKG